MVSVAFPGRPFVLRENVWLISQDITNNRSKLGWQLWIDKTAYSPTHSGGMAHRWMKLNGGYVHEYYGNGFDFRDGTNFLLASGETWVNHNTDGTKSLLIEAAASFDLLGYAELSTTATLPTIPRASVPTFEPNAALVTGSPVTIETHRASASFTHDITYTFQGQTGTVVTALPTDYVWTPPSSMLQAIPNATSGSGYITTVTKNGSTIIGSKNTNFTLAAGPLVIPTWTSVTATEGTTSPAVGTIMGSPTVFVQGISKVVGTINGAAGVEGSTITSKKFTVGGQVYPITSGSSATSAVLNTTGTQNVEFEIVDSRGRKKTQNVSINVLPYTSPQITAVTAQRATSGGTPDPNGIYIRVDVTAAVQSLINASVEKNRRTVRIYTSPRGANTWTLRATPANASTTLSGVVTATFGATAPAHFPTGSSFDIKVELVDQFNSATPTTYLGSVSTAGVMVHFRPGEIGVGMGKFWEQGTLDVAGPIYRDNSLVVAQSDAASNAEVATGTATNKFITPAGLSSRAASETVAGVAELATLAETRSGDAARVVTPSNMLAVVGQRIMVPTASNGTINSDGSVSFSSLSSITVDGVFTSEFPRYKILFEITALSALATMFLNYRAGGANNTTSAYQVTRDYGSGGSTFAVSSSNQTRLEIASASGVGHDGELTVFGPAATARTRLVGVTMSVTSSDTPVPTQVAGLFTSTTAFNGFALLPASGTISGSLTVYGVK